MPTLRRWAFVFLGIFAELIFILYLTEVEKKNVDNLYFMIFLSLISWSGILFSSKLKFFLASLVVLLAPFNRFLILRSEQAYLLGRISDYLLITLHLFEIPLYVYAIIFFLKKIGKLKPVNIEKLKHRLIQNPVYYFVFLFFVSITFIFFKNNFWFVFSRLQILFDFIILYFCLRELKLKQITIFISISAVIQSFISIFQVGLNHSVGMAQMGESVFNESLYFVSKSLIFNQLRVRSYGTFPHPNVLSAFIYISLVLSFYYLLRDISDNRRFKALSLRNIGRVGGIALFLLVIYLCQSRTIILAAVLSFTMILLKFLSQILSGTARFFSIILIILFIIFSSVLIFHERIISLTTYDKSSWINRLELQNISINSVVRSNYLGLGPNGYLKYLAENKGVLTNYSFIVEPVHNVFFLLLSEYGVIVFILFIAVIFSIIFNSIRNNLNSEYFRIVLPITIFLLLSLNLDHYLLTLKQGVFIFVLCFRLLELKRVGDLRIQNQEVANK